jgi:hypothetical protein
MSEAEPVVLIGTKVEGAGEVRIYANAAGRGRRSRGARAARCAANRVAAALDSPHSYLNTGRNPCFTEAGGEQKCVSRRMPEKGGAS